jgi:hypothetical protein
VLFSCSAPLVLVRMLLLMEASGTSSVKSSTRGIGVSTQINSEPPPRHSFHCNDGRCLPVSVPPPPPHTHTCIRWLQWQPPHQYGGPQQTHPTTTTTTCIDYCLDRILLHFLSFCSAFAYGLGRQSSSCVHQTVTRTIITLFLFFTHSVSLCLCASR